MARLDPTASGDKGLVTLGTVASASGTTRGTRAASVGSAQFGRSLHVRWKAALDVVRESFIGTRRRHVDLLRVNSILCQR